MLLLIKNTNGSLNVLGRLKSALGMQRWNKFCHEVIMKSHGLSELQSHAERCQDGMGHSFRYFSCSLPSGSHNSKAPMESKKKPNFQCWGHLSQLCACWLILAIDCDTNEHLSPTSESLSFDKSHNLASNRDHTNSENKVLDDYTVKNIQIWLVPVLSSENQLYIPFLTHCCSVIDYTLYVLYWHSLR